MLEYKDINGNIIGVAELYTIPQGPMTVVSSAFRLNNSIGTSVGFGSVGYLDYTDLVDMPLRLRYKVVVSDSHFIAPAENETSFHLISFNVLDDNVLDDTEYIEQSRFERIADVI